MFVQDKVADMLTKIRNANQMRYETVEVEGTKMTLSIAKILEEEGYINGYEYIKNKTGDKLKLALKYGPKKERVILGLKRISKSGLRVYANSSELPKVLNGLGIAIISTSKGLMTDKKAREQGIGGEVLAYIW
ncbi:MAG: 30S ribosomal protein S8 [Mollicutes bacterium]|nr:30S ribosomal protein S8 [Mollicutes bacterium]